MNKPFGEPDRQQNKQPELREQASWQPGLDSPQKYSGEAPLVQPVPMDFGKRVVAVIIDVLAANLLAYVVALIPIVNSYISCSFTVCFVLLFRDWLYGGRGIGKNLMGLQVVDMKTGLPASLWQSIMRNVVILGPPLILYIILAVLNVLGAMRVSWLGNAQQIIQIIDTLGFLYLLVVLPYEAYRAYNRADRRRLGDELAGTAIVEAPMDFGSPFPRRQR